MGSHRYHGWQDELDELDVTGEVSLQTLPPTAEEIMEACVGDPYFIRISHDKANALKYENDRRDNPWSARKIAGDIWFEMEQGPDDPFGDLDYDRNDVPDAFED